MGFHSRCSVLSGIYYKRKVSVATGKEGSPSRISALQERESG
jgi:hypothetical protein